MQFQPPSAPGWGQSDPNQQQPYSQPEYYQQSQTYYPPQQPQWSQPPSVFPPQKPQSGFKIGLGIGCGIMVSILIAVIVIAVLASSHSSYTPTSSASSLTTPDSSQSPTVSAPTLFSVGETATNGDWSVTVNSVNLHTSGSYTQPAAGNVYLVVDVTAENLTSSPQLVSSGASFTLKDSTGQVYNETLTGIGVPPDGTVLPGTKLRGQISYEVPKTIHEFTFQFQENVFNGDAAIWSVNV